MTSLASPSTAQEQAEADYGDNLIWRLNGSTITSFGASATGEIYLSTLKGGTRLELVIGVDERGDVALWEMDSTAPKEPQA